MSSSGVVPSTTGGGLVQRVAGCVTSAVTRVYGGIRSYIDRNPLKIMISPTHTAVASTIALIQAAASMIMFGFGGVEAAPYLNSVLEFINRYIVPLGMICGSIDDMRKGISNGDLKKTLIAAAELALGPPIYCKSINTEKFRQTRDFLERAVYKKLEPIIARGGVYTAPAAAAYALLVSFLPYVPVAAIASRAGIVLFFISSLGILGELWNYLKDNMCLQLLLTTAMSAISTLYSRFYSYIGDAKSNLEKYYNKIESKLRESLSDIYKHLKELNTIDNIRSCCNKILRVLRGSSYSSNITEYSNTKIDTNMPYTTEAFRLPSNSAEYLRREVTANAAIM